MPGDALPELGCVGSDPDAEDDEGESDDDKRDLGGGLVPEKPRKVEARQVREHVEAGQDALGHGPREQRGDAERVDDRQHEARADELVYVDL